jgi:hypothetical protein
VSKTLTELNDVELRGFGREVVEDSLALVAHFDAYSAEGLLKI